MGWLRYHNIEWYARAKFSDYVSVDKVARVKVNLLIPLSGLRLDEHLPVTYWCHDWHGLGLQPVVSVWQLVPGYETSHPAGYGQDHEGESGLSCSVRVYPERSSAVFFRAHWALLEQSGVWFITASLIYDCWTYFTELFRTVLEPNHLYVVIRFPQFTCN